MQPLNIVQPRARGHVDSPFREHWRHQSHLRNAVRLDRLPTATQQSYDLWEQGLVGPIKNQGQCGTCWDFSGIRTIESALIKAGILKNDGSGMLSEQFIIDCNNTGACNGDDNVTVLQIAKNKGVPLTSEYGAYQAGPHRCNLKSTEQMYLIDDWGFVDGTGQGVTDTQKIKDAMQAYGVIGCAVAADGAFESWGDGNPSSPFQGSGSRQIDHDVSLSGWVDTSTAVTLYVGADLVTTKANGFWLMDNSWGTKWGMKGRMQIAYGANLIGTECVFALKRPIGPILAPWFI